MWRTRSRSPSDGWNWRQFSGDVVEQAKRIRDAGIVEEAKRIRDDDEDDNVVVDEAEHGECPAEVDQSTQIGARAKLKQICGQWTCNKGWKYVVTQAGNIDGLDVTTTKDDGKDKFTHDLIRVQFANDSTYSIFFGDAKHANWRLYELSKFNDEELAWWRENSEFRWRRKEPVLAAVKSKSRPSRPRPPLDPPPAWKVASGEASPAASPAPLRPCPPKTPPPNTSRLASDSSAPSRSSKSSSASAGPQPPCTPPPTKFKRLAKTWCVAPLASPSSLPTLRIVTYGAKFSAMLKGDLEPDFQVDVRRFRDPEAGDLKWHDGRHPEIILRFSQHEDFQEWLQSLRSDLENNLPSGNRPQVVGIFCKSGRHRSVAAATILQHVAIQSGRKCYEIEHLNLERCTCPDCGWQMSRDDVHSRNAKYVLDWVFDMWKNLD